MDPQIKSMLTSAALAGAMTITGWLVHSGLLPSADQSVLANDLVAGLFTGLSALIFWYKQRQHAPAALVTAVNLAVDDGKIKTDFQGASVAPKT